MSDNGKQPGDSGTTGDPIDVKFDPKEYDLMVVLEQLESLEEEMEELGVTTLEGVRQRIAELHKQLDDAE
ncbi:MAG TPA: hypothetical protein VGN32_15085 [Ktedonobacterales bacterium]|nr:hypothetical protein [Ktedonobacterales bacterium]